MRLRSLLLFLLFTIPCGLWAQSGYIQRDIVLNSQGRPVRGATITVCTSVATGIPCTPTTTIYIDETLGTTKSNPTTTDGNGNYSFAIPFGSTYVVTVSGSGLTGYSYRLTTTLPTVLTQLECVEGSAPSGVTSHDIQYCDSTAHRFKMKNNNGSALTVAATSGDTFTTTTLTTPTITNPIINNTPTGTGIATVTMKKGSGGGSYSTSSTSYVDVDGTNLAYTVTIPTGWKLSIKASGELSVNTAAVAVLVSLLDSATVLEQGLLPSATGASQAFSLDWVINGDGNSHTIKLQYKTSNGADAAVITNASATRLPTMVFILTPSN